MLLLSTSAAQSTRNLQRLSLPTEGPPPHPQSLGIKALHTWLSGAGATLFTWEASRQRLQPEQSISKSGFDPCSQDCRRPVYKLEHNTEGRRGEEGGRKRGKERKEGESVCELQRSGASFIFSSQYWKKKQEGCFFLHWLQGCRDWCANSATCWPSYPGIPGPQSCPQWDGKGDFCSTGLFWRINEKTYKSEIKHSGHPLNKLYRLLLLLLWIFYKQ